MLDLSRPRSVAVADSNGNLLRRPDGSVVRVTVGGAPLPPPTPANSESVGSELVEARTPQGELHEIEPLTDAKKIRRIDALEQYRARTYRP